jgi:hypothetical protein
MHWARQSDSCYMVAVGTPGRQQGCYLFMSNVYEYCGMLTAGMCMQDWSWRGGRLPLLLHTDLESLSQPCSSLCILCFTHTCIASQGVSESCLSVRRSSGSFIGTVRSASHACAVLAVPHGGRLCGRARGGRRRSPGQEARPRGAQNMLSVPNMI